MTEYNFWRKLWHAGGSVAMVALYLSWVSIGQMTLVLAFAWLVAVFVIVVDFVRLSSSYYGEAIKRMKFFGKLMRKHEEYGYNAASYFIIAAGVILTVRWLGGGDDRLICAAVLVAGIADPITAGVRHWRRKKGQDSERSGLFAFTVVSWLILVSIGRIGVIESLLISLIVAAVETYTPEVFIQWLIFSRPFVKRHKIPVLIRRLYPDDNLLIPLLVFFLGIFFSRF